MTVPRFQKSNETRSAPATEGVPFCWCPDLEVGPYLDAFSRQDFARSHRNGSTEGRRVMRELVESAMPNLQAFDQEFERDPTPRPERRRRILRLSTILAFLLGGGIVGALALAWPETLALVRAELPPGLMASLPLARDPAEEQNEQLLAELDALKQEVRDLTQAQHEAATTIAGLKAAEQESKSRAVSIGWYSDAAVLNFPIATRPAANGMTRRRGGLR